ncbi:MAG: response regulator transcription factor [Anaerolineales bacterium]|nr:response regulator transcription factor [Anaerolineales bacterium]MCB9147113.1 response regulator transcription factor [Anaerolineales bacterium]
MPEKEYRNKENPLHILSQREIQVLKELANGNSNKTIALSLGITINTVEKHLTLIYQKINVKSRAEAILWWMQNGGGFRN